MQTEQEGKQFLPILSIFNTDLDEIQYTSFPHNVVEIGEVFENRCNECYAVLNGATEIFVLICWMSQLIWRKFATENVHKIELIFVRLV